jgi:hypothetical protein
MTKDLLFALGILISCFFQTIFIGKFFLDAAKECETVIPLTEQATKIYHQICSNGLNKKDFSVVYKYIHDLKT